MAGKTHRVGRWPAILALSAVLGLLLWGLPYVAPGPPPGRRIDAGGFRLHLVCTGQGGPPVILEAGSGDAWLTWFRVQPEVARVTRVCSYDRAGLGDSDPGPRPRSRRRQVEELHTLLARAGVRPPYVLVGHSYGGINVQLFAALHPREVAGLVLVDSSYEDHWARAPREFWGNHQEVLAEERDLAERAARGERMAPIESIAGLPTRARRQLAVLARRPAWYLASYDESLIADDTPRELAGVPRKIEVPLVVLSAGLRTRPPDRPKELHERWVRVAAELQNEIAARSPRSRHVVVAGAGHSIQWDRPDVVVAEIERLVADLHRSSYNLR
jgi:pimeloyl-ACP methyl ester carboxylesterase